MSETQKYATSGMEQSPLFMTGPSFKVRAGGSQEVLKSLSTAGRQTNRGARRWREVPQPHGQSGRARPTPSGGRRNRVAWRMWWLRVRPTCRQLSLPLEADPVPIERVSAVTSWAAGPVRPERGTIIVGVRIIAGESLGRSEDE